MTDHRFWLAIGVALLFFCGVYAAISATFYYYDKFKKEDQDEA